MAFAYVIRQDRDNKMDASRNNVEEKYLGNNYVVRNINLLAYILGEPL